MRHLRLALPLLAMVLPASAYDLGYGMSLDQYKETSALTNTFSFVENLSRTVSINLDASFRADRSIDLDRFLENRTGRAWVSWRPTGRIELATSISRSIMREDRFGELIQDQLNNTTAGEIRYTPLDWASVSMSLGSHYLDYENVSGDSTIRGHDEGGVRTVGVTFQKPLFQRLSTSLTFGEDRTLGRQTDNGRDNLTARVNYSFPGLFEGGSLGVQASAARMFTTFSDSNYSHREQNWSHNVVLTLPPLFDDVSMQLSTGWNWDKRYWENEADTLGQGDPRDRLGRMRTMGGHLRWQMTGNLVSEFQLSRSIDRNDRKRTAYGTSDLFDVYDLTDDRYFSSTVTYMPGASRLVFQRSIELYTYDTMGSWPGPGDSLYEDNSDRDELREVLSLDVEVPVGPRLTLLSSIQGQNLETVYLKSELSGNSKSSSTYSFTPGYEYDLGGGWDIEHSVKLSADYTTFRFPASTGTGSDLLFRRVDSSISLQRMSPDSTTLGIGHRLRVQDQGSFDGGLFSRSEESINNTVTLNTGFHIGRSVGVTPSYSYEYSKRSFLASSAPPLEEHLHHLGLRSRMGIGEGTLTVNITRTMFSNDRPGYWNASVGFNYVF